MPEPRAVLRIDVKEHITKSFEKVLDYIKEVEKRLDGVEQNAREAGQASEDVGAGGVGPDDPEDAAERSAAQDRAEDERQLEQQRAGSEKYEKSDC